MKKTKIYLLLKKTAQLFRDRIIFDIFLFHYGKYLHHKNKKNCIRSNNHSYTSFYRSPSQLKALSLIITEQFQSASANSLKIAIFAGSNGSEAYTVASYIMNEIPDMDFDILCSDLHQENIDFAKKGVYLKKDLKQLPVDFITRTFTSKNDELVVKNKIKSKINFITADLLDKNFAQNFDNYDIIFMQNVLFHLSPEDAEFAFKNVMKLLRPKSALFIEGMDLDQKERLTTDNNLEPFVYNMEEIYRQSRLHIPRKWWHYYYGSEPISIFNRKQYRRFSTIFLKKNTVPSSVYR